MDGLLIDSEPLWCLAETEVFGLLGITLTAEMCQETKGRRIDDVVSHWYQRYPWNGRSIKNVKNDILHYVKELIEQRGTALQGVHLVLEALHHYPLKIGLASSSPLFLIETVINKLDIGNYFDVMCSAVGEKFGKPHPAVYLTAAKRLQVRPGDCIVFEDSITGISAAKSAGMMTVAVPAPNQYDDIRFEDADIKLRSLRDFNLEMIRCEQWKRVS